MAKKLSRATGNWLTAGTWETIDETSYVNSESANSAVTTSYTAATAATTGVITATGIGLKLANRTGTTGTLSVHLAIAGVEVTGTLVTINTADLPAAVTADLNGGWIFFKFASPVILAGATSYAVEVKTSSSNQVSLFSSSGTLWSHFISTNATGAPGAGDDIVIAGEYTGAGTSNSFTVTMDETATTDYGAASTSLVTPAIAVCDKGTLSYGSTAATNYLLKVSGNVIIYINGVFNMGTTGTPIPRGGTAALNFDCGANVDFGLTVRNLGTYRAQGLSRTSGKVIDRCKLNTDEAVNSTSLGVDTDTGWLDNDEIAVATTTRTTAQCEKGTMNGNAGASTLTVDGFAGSGGGLAFAHSGTAPTQAEVILLTRNVNVYGASASLQAYIDIKATAIIDCDWARFYWLGSATANKRGIDTACTTGSQSFSYCARDSSTVTGSMGWNMTGASGSGLNIDHCVSFNCVSNHYANAASTGSWVLDSNIFMYNTENAQLVILFDVGGTFTNNTMISCSSNATFAIAESGGTIGTISGNTVHGAASTGMNFSQPVFGTITNQTIWRSGGYGLLMNAGEIVWDTLVMFGNGNNISLNASAGFFTFLSAVLSGDSSFATGGGVVMAAPGQGCWMKFISSTFGVVSGIKTAHTTDISLNTLSALEIYLINTLLTNSTTAEVGSQASMAPSSFIASQKHDQTAGLHKTWKRYGTITIETTTTHTGGQSIKMTPLSASFKLESSGAYGGFRIAVANGQSVTPKVYVYEDASYNGNRARLIVKRNDALGITADTVIATATSASDAAWELLTGATATVTDDGVLEFVIDCDGTAGNLFVDSFSV